MGSSYWALLAGLSEMALLEILRNNPVKMRTALAALALIVAAGSAEADECEGVIKL
jgi:predicted benzoate:H+ symporter BenE